MFMWSMHEGALNDKLGSNITTLMVYVEYYKLDLTVVCVVVKRHDWDNIIPAQDREGLNG